MYLCIILCMINTNLTLNTSQLSSMAKSLGITQEDISNGTGISQSQVSRLLSGHGKRQSKSYIEICNYVNSCRNGISPELVRQNDELINALASVWDGSARQSAAIANIIQSLGGICTISNPKPSK